MFTSRLFRLSVGALVLLASRPSIAQQHIALPPVNLGASSFMDGPGGAGLMTREVVTVFDARRFTGADGQRAPGNNTLTTLTEITHVAYSPPTKVLGGYWGVEILAPVAMVDVTTPAGEARAVGIGDLTWVRLSSGEENPCEVDHLTLRSRVFRGGSGSGLLPFA
jgi:hypothetical protein